MTLSRRPATILLVEDDPAQRQALLRILSARGYRVASAGTAVDALDLVDAEPPDLALIDLGPPDMDGLDLLRRSLGTGPARPQLETDHSVGYRLVAPVAEFEGDDEPVRLVTHRFAGMTGGVLMQSRPGRGPFVFVDAPSRALNGHDEGSSNPEKPVDEWVTGDEPMTGPQRSYLETLSREAGSEVPDTLSKAEASQLIERLQRTTGRGDPAAPASDVQVANDAHVDRHND